MTTLVELIIAIALAIVVVLIHYETLRLTSVSLDKLSMPPRQRILVVIFAALFAHIIEITLYAFSYMMLDQLFSTGMIAGQPADHFYDYFYFSMVSYTTLGIGDYYPLEGLRLLTGFESLVGLMMITWTASFTYLAMEKFWKLH